MDSALLTFADVAAAVRRSWRPALLWGIVAAAGGVAVALLRPKQYEARASFVPEPSKPRNLPTGLGALAAQFGFDMNGSIDRSPQFYRDLVLTTGLLSDIVDSIINTGTGSDPTTVRQLLGVSADSSRVDLDRALRRLRRHIGAEADPRTSVVTISIVARSPTAAEAITGLLIRQVQHFNVVSRQLQARQTRIFLETRVTDALQALHDAEDQLRHFYEQNRRYSDSPQLVFEETRLKRQVDLRQDLYTTLSKQLETTRIDEVNDTPTITVIDPPFASNRPTGPGTLTLAVLACFLAIGLRVGAQVLRG